jgi:glycosyltransferase involved in cell wall biosynthesis
MASGSGSNLKLVDYCSSGLPVVTTRFGARGFSDELVRELRVVEPDGFAAAIASAAAEDWSERVERARWICLERYAWSALADELAAVLRAAA